MLHVGENFIAYSYVVAIITLKNYLAIIETFQDHNRPYCHMHAYLEKHFYTFSTDQGHSYPEIQCHTFPGHPGVCSRPIIGIVLK